MKPGLFFVCLGLCLAACGTPTGTCDTSTATRPDDKQCTEYEAGGDFISVYEQGCAANDGTWRDGLSCPRENAFGACRISVASVTQTTWFYMGGEFTSAMQVMNSCPTGGYIAP
jgi:hypothetical protein